MSIYGFNKAYKNITASYLKVGDDSMSEIRSWTTAKGNLPELYYIFCKPPLGTELKTAACYINGVLLFIYTQRGKEGTNNSKYQLQTG